MGSTSPGASPSSGVGSVLCCTGCYLSLVGQPCQSEDKVQLLPAIHPQAHPEAVPPCYRIVNGGFLLASSAFSPLPRPSTYFSGLSSELTTMALFFCGCELCSWRYCLCTVRPSIQMLTKTSVVTLWPCSNGSYFVFGLFCCFLFCFVLCLLLCLLELLAALLCLLNFFLCSWEQSFRKKGYSVFASYSHCWTHAKLFNLRGPQLQNSVQNSGIS